MTPDFHLYFTLFARISKKSTPTAIPEISWHVLWKTSPGARILAVCDVFETMTADLPGMPALAGRQIQQTIFSEVS